MGISVLPKTTLGRWSVGLAVAIILFAVLAPVLEYQVGLELRLHSVIRIMLAAALGISSVGAFATGLISTMKSKERCVLVFLAVVLGFWFLVVSLDMAFAV